MWQPEQPSERRRILYTKLHTEGHRQDTLELETRLGVHPNPPLSHLKTVPDISPIPDKRGTKTTQEAVDEMSMSIRNSFSHFFREREEQSYGSSLEALQRYSQRAQEHVEKTVKSALEHYATDPDVEVGAVKYNPETRQVHIDLTLNRPQTIFEIHFGGKSDVEATPETPAD